MSQRPWMPLYIGDIKRKTDDLSATEYGIYIRLIEWAWDHDGKIPLDVAQLSNITRCDRRFWWRFGAPIVSRFFDAVDGSTALQKRVVTELRRAEEISNKRKAAAQQMLSKRSANAQQMHTHSHLHSKEKEIKNKEKESAVERSGSNGPRSPAGKAVIGERMGDYVWDGGKWAERKLP
jgi:uncharacterized protein YdaU (DUF1376 family)